MFAVLYFPQFPLQAVLRHSPEGWNLPVALIDPALATPRVVDATTPARHLGISDGLSAPQALARCRNVQIRHRSAAQEKIATDAILQSAFALSPNLESTQPGTVTLDLRGLISLSGTGASHGRQQLRWAGQVRESLASLGLDVRVGIASTPIVAGYAAQWGDRCFQAETSSLAAGAKHPTFRERAADSFDEAQAVVRDLNAVVVREPTRFLAELPVAALGPSTDVGQLLRRWGIRTVGEFLKLGQAELAERLGLEALALWAAASGTTIRPLRLEMPAQRFEERHEFEPGIETLEPLLFLLRRFVDALAPRLESLGLVAGRLTLVLGLESGAVLERPLQVPQPTRRGEVLFRMLHTHLEGLRTDSLVKSVSLKVDPTQPETRQFSLFEATLRDPHQFQETLARLVALLGADRVGSPRRLDSHQPDSFRLVPPDFEHPIFDPGSARPELIRQVPLRRFRPRLPAQVETAVSEEEFRSPASNPGEVHPEVRRNESVIELLGPILTKTNERERRKGSGIPDAEPSRNRVPSLVSSASNSRVEAREGKPADTSQAAGESGVRLEPVLRPLSLRCEVAHGRLTVAVGPVRSSGQWWEGGGWEREEWDVSLREGRVLRLSRVHKVWEVEGELD